MGRAGSPSSKSRTASFPTSSGRTATVATATSSRPVELPQKSTSGSPCEESPARTPRTAPVSRFSARSLCAVSFRSNAILLHCRKCNSVMQYILPFQDHISVRLSRDLAGTFQGDILSLNNNCAVLFQCDAGVACLEGDFVGGYKREYFVYFQLIIPNNIGLPHTVHLLLVIASNRFVAVTFDRYALVRSDTDRLIGAHGHTVV